MAASASLHRPHPTANETITPEVRQAIELELDAICSDVLFHGSQRNCAFLRYVITETLAGRADGIKERTLGKELFGRPISYDTGSDAVVRVRANEVRKRLIGYYETHKSQAGWRVHLPLRTYVPVFVRESERKPQESVAAPALVVSTPLELQQVPDAFPALPHVQLQEPAIPQSESFVPPLSPARMMIPTLVALFLCAVMFRWQASSGTPYLDFWENMLNGHAGVLLVLDADSADPRAVTTNDLELVEPLLQTAAMFHASTQIGSSAATRGRDNLLAVHITHRSPQEKVDDAAYITLIPGPAAQLWVGSKNKQALDLAVNSISNAELFPAALQVAARRRGPTRLRFVDEEQVTTETLPAGDSQWKY